MRTKKTATSKRETYKYYFSAGERITLIPGIDGVTEEHIKLLHSLDDSEVYYNLKNSRIVIENQDNENSHSNEQYFWNTSFDQAAAYDEGYSNDKSKIMFKASFSDTVDNAENVETRVIIKQIVDSRLSTNQKKVIALIDYGYKSTEIAKILGISDAAITKTRKKIAEIFSEYKMYL